MLDELRSGPLELRSVVNALVREVNSRDYLRGDGRYITVERGLVSFNPRPMPMPMPGGKAIFLAQLTAIAVLGSTTARWKYTWAEAVFTGDTIGALSGGRFGNAATAPGGTTSDLGYAINIAEANVVAKSGTTAWYVDGIQANSTTTGSAYPAGFAPQPVGGGSSTHGQQTWKVNATVEMWFEIDTTGILKPVFFHPVSHDGTCA